MIAEDSGEWRNRLSPDDRRTTIGKMYVIDDLYYISNIFVNIFVNTYKYTSLHYYLTCSIYIYYNIKSYIIFGKAHVLLFIHMNI